MEITSELTVKALWALYLVSTTLEIRELFSFFCVNSVLTLLTRLTSADFFSWVGIAEITEIAEKLEPKLTELDLRQLWLSVSESQSYAKSLFN